MMKPFFKYLLPLLLGVLAFPALAEPFSIDRHDGQYSLFNQLFNVRPTVPSQSVPPQPEKDPRIRSHQEGILEISGLTITPARIAVKAGPVAVVGSVELTVRNETNSRWFFRAENIGPETNIWDSKGRAVLVPGKVTCQVLHRASLNDYQQAGLTLGVDVPGFSFSNGGSVDKLRSDFFEDEDICPLGEVPALTTQREIEIKCKQCLGRVLKTIKEDVNARLSSLSYRIDTPICTLDSDCYREDSDWLKGRCVLVKDKNGSYLSECRARSSVGGACPGKGSRGLFEYPCDKDLACVKTYSAKGFTDSNRYECRDPKNWKFKGPLKASLR